MKIKILKGECLFNEQGTHVIVNDQVLIAQEDTEIEVLERIDAVLELCRVSRETRGLDKDGNPIPPPQSELTEE